MMAARHKETNILIVHDTLCYTQLLRKFLVQNGYNGKRIDVTHFVEGIIRRCQTTRYDILILTDRIDDTENLHRISEIEERLEETKVVIICDPENQLNLPILFWMRASLLDYKSIGRSKLLEVIEMDADKSFTSKSLRNKLRPEFGTPNDGDEPLSKIQQQILKMVCHDFTEEEIAKSLDCPVESISDYIRELMELLQVKGLAGLIRYSIQRELFNGAKMI